MKKIVSRHYVNDNLTDLVYMFGTPHPNDRALVFSVHVWYTSS
jgi:hypothetical protein